MSGLSLLPVWGRPTCIETPIAVRRLDELDTRPFVREAVRIRGSQAKLARAIGVSQARVNQLARDVPCCSAEIAVAIERATEGAILRSAIRPDLWETVQIETVEPAAQAERAV